ncbi:hypothetical protein EF847_01625 [Actinobacteria bacterium YIM 96077]|uniref:Uncharacterized protein n=1 Tax=Phytoactinopolyspora halophila TaxID=1981511 RepID=A0A329QFE3_9ACTN|nr:hypothetical protein EF847_01625 [Actinobacteria bacterium YIM 96077]RAW11165.1 hypothetical protein DPM12_17650 [Phytoactinopolyspora halophila]
MLADHPVGVELVFLCLTRRTFVGRFVRHGEQEWQISNGHVGWIARDPEDRIILISSAADIKW